MKKKWNLFLSDHYPDGYGTGPTGTGFSSGGGTGCPIGITYDNNCGAGTGSFDDGNGWGEGRTPSDYAMSEWLVVERA